MNINKVSQSIASQSPEFLKTDYPLFNKFIEYYYRSQEKTGMGQNIINNFLQYLDIDKLDINILGGTTKVVEGITAESDEIVVESVDNFLDANGSILIGDEVIYYESSTAAPNIALSPGISYDQVKLKWTGLAQIIDLFDGVRVRFPLTSQSSPIGSPSAQHLIVSLYGEVLIPNVDYTVDGTDIVFTTAPRTRITGDDNVNTYITFLSGFIENTIVSIDDISATFGDNKTEFKLTSGSVKYEPIADEYILAVYDNTLLIPGLDFFIDGDLFIFNEAPLNGRILSLYSIEAPIPTFGAGAVGYARINNAGELTGISSSKTGSGYEYTHPPRVSVNHPEGFGASASALVNGIKDAVLLDGGKGYSDTNPPTVVVQNPINVGAELPQLKATVTNGSVSSLEVENSGSGYTFVPRVTFKQPGGAKIGTATLTDGSITGTIAVIDGGQGYSTVPTVYVDEPTGEDPVTAALTATLTDGKVTAITIVNGGQGYETVPRVAIVDPTGAQVLQTLIDADGRVVSVELLDGGSGYDDVPSVYIIDPREDGGTGATATASVFNGKITDINIGSFGSGYSIAHPPEVIIQNPPEATSSVQIGLNEVTGFSVSKKGQNYTKAKFEGCARAVSGIVEYTGTGNAVFSNNTTAAVAAEDAEVKCLDALFVKRLLDKYTEQFLPDVPELDYTKIDVRNAIKSVKDFYSTKGTSFSIAYLFKLLYGEQVSVSYPKDQITKPSAATWSIDTILRATLVSGDPTDIKDGLLTQDESIADPNIKEASALIENYISIKTSDVELFELVLSEETIDGSFVVPYKTKLAEPLDTTNSIITVDSTIGWPERNGEFIIGGTELIQYKEKSLNQFIECTRSVNGTVEDWDSATEITSNLQVYVNKGTAQEVILNVVGIVDAQQTVLTDTGSYYLAGDKLSVSKLGGSSQAPELNTWLYNVKKLLTVNSITFGGVDNRFATVTCANNHGLLVGDQVTVYGANPIIYNGTFLVTSRDSTTVFQYQLPQTAEVTPQGNILVSVDLNKGKSDNSAVFRSIGPYTTNIQNSFFDDNYVYVASTGIPNYTIGPFPGSALLPGNQRKLNRFPLNPSTISIKDDIVPGPIGTWINGTSVWSYKSSIKKTFGPVTAINITNSGQDYDAASPPNITISGGGGEGATGSVTVNGSIIEIAVDSGGSGYTSSPLISIVGGGGSGASATAIVTKGVVSSVLVNNGGSGYTSQPSITVVGGGGTGATATASVRGPIQSIAVTNGGDSYTTKPTVTLSSGTGAVAQAIVNNGRIISIAIISAGTGYTTAPEVTIQGVGFGAIAKATIDTDGENAGRVTNIEILNRGINYVQGTTLINLTSAGSNATFEPTVFEWTYNLQETTTVDSAKGSVFAGFNNQYGGEYAHISNPQKLRYILGDNLFENVSGAILEQDSQLEHSPIIGWAFDGNPIFGPYGYSDPTDQSSNIVRLNTSYQLKTNLVYNEISNPTPVRQSGPLLSDEEAGRFIEDYEYSFGLGDLDQYNGRFCKTPDFPEGRYCYFITIDTTEDGNALFPYVLGPSFNSIADPWNLNKDAVQQNIPTGVVRYRDPYENVDIDVDRAPNASTNALSLENGDILLFEVEDENRDGVITQDELDDPDQIFEESPLQLFDYFPSVRFDSKVDIEVETTTKFEDASVSGFIIEDAGKSYQVDDILTFDNEDTDGTGVSARVSKITGESISSYTFETEGDDFIGVLTTSEPHNIVEQDNIYVSYNPIMDETNKQYFVRQFKGIEEIVINQSGSGYDSEIPPTVIIDGDGESGELNATVSSTGSIAAVNIVNSGINYTKDPRVILSHPQIYKKADYYVSLIKNENYVKVNDVFVNGEKDVFFCGKTLDTNGNEVAFISKFSELGVKEWEERLESQDGETYTEYIKLDVDGDIIWVVGHNKPNSSILTAYNPDVILVKYTQAIDGLSATLNFQKGYSGISGSTRADNITTVKKYSDSRYIIGGYTNTNSSNPQDAFIASIDAAGSFAAKRKLASASGSEKITDLIVLDDAVYFIMETSTTDGNADSKFAFGKVLVGTSQITVEWIKEINNSAYSFRDTSLAVDEFNEFYVTATLALKTDNTTKDSFWVGKLDISGDLLWNYRYVVPAGNSIELASRSTIDIFGDLNLGYTRIDSTNGYRTIDTAKIGYDGKLKSHTNTEFNKNNIEGITVNAITVDNSGDVYAFGQTHWNRNEVVCEFATDATDKTGHYTLTTLSATDSVKYESGLAKIYGYDPTGSNSTWINGAIKIPGTQLTTKLDADWTLEFMLYKEAANSQTLSQTQQTLVNIGDATDATGGLWLYYDAGGRLELVVTNNSTAINSAGGALQSTQTTLYADDTWQFIGLKKSGDTFTVYVNGTQILTGSISNTSLANKDLYIGNIIGKDGTTGSFRKNEQGQYYVDNLVIKNRAITPDNPSDVTTIPPVASYALGFTWADTTWFTNHTNRYDYVDYVGFGFKSDKNSDSERLGDKGVQTNTNVGFVRTAITPVTGVSLVASNTGFALGGGGLQALDFEDATTTMVVNPTDTNITYSVDLWSARTATVPSPGSKKLSIDAKVKNRYYMKTTSTSKIDNVQELTINQSFNITVGSKLVLNNTSDVFINSGYVLSVDKDNNKVNVAVNNNPWSNDLNTGLLSTTRFDEQDTFGITGPLVADTNIISEYYFLNVINTTPGTFDIDLNDWNLNRTASAGSGNLDDFAKFKPFAADVYSVRIDEVSGSTPYITGSVVEITASDISFNTAKTTAQITNLTGVTKITLIADLDKVLQVTAVANTDEVYIITGNRHYLSAGDNIFVDGNPTQTVGATAYDEYDGSFTVETVVSNREFTYKLNAVAQTDPATSPSDVSIYVKSPVLKMYYGHQYRFDLSHSSMLGANLSFSKDNLYKLEYSFNSIERIGTPGVTGEGQAAPTVKLKVDQDIVTNISYYFDPSRTGDDSPVDPNSYCDIVDSPYVGTFTVSEIAGATITTGATILKFPLINEPEGNANISRSSYSTSSKKAVGSIGDIRLINSGGFYAKLPVVTGIQSSRKIERVQINEPGTEYAVGTYNSVPISGDGEGGLVTIVVADGTNDDGDTIPGQIQSVTITSPGKGYTTANIDIEAITGILGAGLAGSGAEIDVVIPPFGTGAVVFAKGTNVGKIKKLKNNNFGYDYPHDYTLRPEITFPINAQLTSTSILDSITVTDPGSGYSQAPAVVITGGGGSNAIAEASIRNGRIEQIFIKDPGAGYSSAPNVSLRSSFNYVVNLDLGLLQFAFPHGIQNGAEVTLNVVDTGDGVEFPLASGAIGRLNAATTYYAVAGIANSLEGDQLKLAITKANAELGDAITFANAGTGRQQVLTESFGAAATANVITSTFLEGELVYQGDTLSTATATGYVSTNEGWQIGPRVLKIVDYVGTFSEGQSITGAISKSSGVISDLKIAKGVLEVGPITKTTGQFIDDVGKPSEIIQKIQDSYYYQDFSYAVKSSVSIDDWKDILIKNVHPASFKVFGELNIDEYGYTANKEIDFELTKSVELARDATVPNIQSFALAEPIYSEFNNTEVLFRQKRLTSSENILTSVVQRLDNISNLFDGERTQFPITVNGDNVIANANQLLIVLNGVAQTPATAFEVQGDSIVFAEPPQPPASVKYVSVGIQQVATKTLRFPGNSGIFPSIGMELVGISSTSRLTVTSVAGESITGFITQGTFILNEQCQVSATGFSGALLEITDVTSNGLFGYNESVSNLEGNTAVVEAINLETGQETPIAELRYSIGAASTSIEVVSSTSTGDAPVTAGTFTAGENYQIASEIVRVDSISNGTESTTLIIVRGQLGTAAISHQEDTPLYSTEIEVTDELTLSKTTGTYQSTPGLFDIQTGDTIIGASSGVVALITSTSAYQDPATNEFIEQVNISSGSSFFGLLFNRLTSVTYPNIILDDISSSQVSIVDFDDNASAFDSKFPANESVSNNILTYNTANNHTYVGGTSTGALTFNDSSTKDVTDATYNSDTGQLVLTIGSHSYTTSNTVTIGANKLSFTCDLDANSTVHTYPRVGDPVYNTAIAITAVAATTITVNVGIGGAFIDNETIRNYKIRYGSNSGEFGVGENFKVKKLTLTGEVGEGFFAQGQVIRTQDTKAEIVGYSQARNTIYLGKIGRTQSSGQDYHNATFVDNAQLNTHNAKFGSACLSLSGGTSAHTFVSGVTNAIVASNGATGSFTAATGTTYNPLTGVMVIEIGTHTLTTANKVTIADSGVVFTCTMDGGATNHAYPRSTDPSSGTALTITAVTGTTITVNVTAVAIDDYLTIPTSSEFGFGTGDFTVETWIKLNSITGSQTIFDMRSSPTELAPYLYTDGANIKYFNNGAVTITGATNLVKDTWYHVALTRSGTSTKVFLDGVQEGSTYSDSSNYGSTKPIRIGGDENDQQCLAGYVDNFRVSNVARYTSQFSAPKGMFHGDVNTKLLLHFDGTNGQKYTQDWSGSEGFTNGEEFNNSAITRNNREYGGIHKFVSATANAVESGGNYAHTFVSAVANGVVSNAGNLPNPVIGAAYTPSTGNLVITSNAHNLTTSNTVTIADDTLTFKCAMDGNTTHHTYPRSGDPASGQTLAVTAVSTNTFTVNVGTSPIVAFNVSDATYDANTGVLVLTIGSHSLPVGESIRIAANSLTFSCDRNNFASNHTYPRSTDPAHNNALRVNAVTATTIAVNVGTVKGAKYVITGGVHTFVSGTTGGITPNSGSAVTAGSGTTYNGVTGDMVLEIGSHSLTTSNTVQIATGAVTFTCDKDGHQTNHSYPRASDPVAGTNIAITAVTATTITVNVGKVQGQLPPFTGGGTHNFVSGVTNALTASAGASGTFTAASGTTYDHLTGDLVIEIGSHSLTTSNKITIADGAVTFTCDADNHTSNHAYPRSTDPVSGKALAIIAETATTITVNVGVAAKTTELRTHRYYDAANSVEQNIDLLSAEGNHAAVVASPFQFDALQSPTVMNASTITPESYYGGAVAVSTDGTTDRMVVGAFRYNSYTGRAYIYDLDGGNEIVLNASDAATGDYYGYAVAVNANKVAVGAPNNDDGGSESGCIYTYSLDGTGESKIVASDDAANDYFGWSIAMTDTYIFVGAPGDASKRGSVYRYDLNGANETKIEPSDGVAGDSFGMSIAVGSNKLVVGSKNHDAIATDAGAVYVYALDGTGEVKITDSAVDAQDNFGAAVAVGENKVVVGCAGYDGASGGTSNAGAIFVYNLDGTGGIKIEPSDVGNIDNFGSSVAVAQGKIFASSPYWDAGVIQNSGQLYAFNLDGTGEASLVMPPVSPYDNPGYNPNSLAVGSNRIILGAQFADPSSNSSAGSVFFWRFTQELTSISFSGTYKTILQALIQDMRNGSNSHVWDASAALVDRSGASVSGIVGYTIVDDNQLLTGLQTIQGLMRSIVNYVPITIAGSHGYTQFTDATVTDQSYTTLSTLTAAAGTTYTASTGLMVITSNNHGLTKDSLIRINPDSLSFTCSKDNNETVHTYPRKTDPFYNKVLKVIAVTTNTFTVNVSASPTGEQYTHTFSSALTNGIVVLNYTRLGCADVVSTVHNLLDIAEDTISEAIGTTTNDQNADHLATVTKVTPITEFVGATVDAFQQNEFIGTYHDGANDLVYTNQLGADSQYRFRDAANLIRANSSVIVDKASADMLNRYPDLNTEMPRNILGSTAGTERCQADLGIIVNEIAKDIENGGNENTVTAAKFYLNTFNEIQHIRLQVWQSVYAHERLGFYIKQAINGNLDYTNTNNIITGDWGITNDAVNQFTASTATYDPATGLLEATIGSHSLEVGNLVNVANNSLTFKCAMDGNATNHAYPRSTDPASGSNLELTAVSGTTITFNVGTTPNVNYTPTAATYNTTTGDLVLTIGSHSLSTGQTVKLATDSLTFECPAAVGTHTFISGVTSAITSSAGGPFTAGPGTTYNPTTGDLVLEIGTNTLSTSDTIQIANNGIVFTCDADNHATNHAYPRATDPVSGQNIAITAVAGTTITVNVGVASATSQSTYPRATGAATSSGADYAYDTPLTITNTTGTSITLNVNGGQGAISVNSAHTFVSATSGALITGGNYAHTFVSATANGITSGGACANVQNAVDTLITTVNDLIAPTSNDYNIAADRLYFNRKYIAEEISGRNTGGQNGLLGQELRYTIDSGTYNAISYNQDTYDTYIKDFIIALISDLQTGGDNSVITQMQKFLSTDLKISDDIDSQLFAFFYTHEQIKMLAEKAIKNILYNSGSSVSGDEYAAVHTNDSAYRDTETPTDITSVVTRMRRLIDIALDVIAPGDVEARSAVKNILFNENYYKAEIASTVNTQFGTNSWQYDSFVSDIIDNIQYDLFTTDTGKSKTAYTVTLESYSGTFAVGNTLTDGTNIAEILYVSGNTLIIGAPFVPFTPTAATYDPATGDLVLTIGTHTLTTSNTIRLSANSLTFECDNNGTAERTYPRALGANTGSGADYAYNTDLSITAVGATTITVNINGGQGAISHNYAHTFVSAIADAVQTDGSLSEGASITSSGATGTIDTDGVTPAHQWYENISNIKTIQGATAISSLIEGSVTNTNLWTSPEIFNSNWSANLSTVTADTGNSPDSTKTSDKIAVTETTGEHYIERTYSLTAFDTFDSDGTTFDNGTETFDTGANDALQTFTSSMFVKASEYNNVQFQVRLDGGTVNAKFKVDLNTGTLGSLFVQPGISVIDHGAIPFGNGWFRLYITAQFGYGFTNLRNRLNVLQNITQVDNFTGTSTNIKVSPSDTNPYAYFGYQGSLDIGNGKIVVGGYNDSADGFNNNGSVRIFDIDGTNEIELTCGNANDNQKYGYDVAVGNNKIAVGAYGTETDGLANAGAVYLYDLNGSSEMEITLDDVPGSTLFAGQFFGYSVSIANSQVFVGCPNVSQGGVGACGAVFVFDLNGEYVRTITASDKDVNDGFGHSIDTGNGKLVVGVPGEGSNGKVYVYNLDGTSEVGITSSNPEGGQMGNAVAVGENKIVVGAYLANANSITGSGKAYIYDLDGTNEVELYAPVGRRAQTDMYGSSVAVGSGKIAIGAQQDETTGSETGLVYTYDLDGTNVEEEEGFDSSNAEFFGSAVELFDGKLYAAAYSAKSATNVLGVGAVYIVDVTGGAGVFAWGAKLTNQALATYVAVSGQEFYANAEFNIKKFALDLMQDQVGRALADELPSPSESASFYKFFDTAAATKYDANTINGFVRTSIDIIKEQLKSSIYYTTITENNPLTVPVKNYGDRSIPVGISGEIIGSDFIYSEDKDNYAEIQTVTLNEANIAKVYKRFRIDGDITDGPFVMNEVVQKQGDATVTGIVYGFATDENYKYLDVQVTGGTWQVLDTIVGATNTTTAQMTAIEDRVHIIDIKGSFTTDIPFKGYTSGNTAKPITFANNQAAVTNNTGGKLTVDTETLIGSLEVNSVLYPESSREYLEVTKYAGLDLEVGDKVASIGHRRLTVSIDSNFNQFVAGHKIYQVIGTAQNTNVYGVITEVDTANNYIYYVPVQGTINNGNTVGDYGLGGVVLQGSATISNITTVAGAASGLIQDIRDAGLNKRLYLTNISGTFSGRDGIRGAGTYRSAVVTREILRARVKRFFKGFDGTQTTFDLTINNGTQYLPDPDGHMLVFINGVLQPPGSGNSYNAFSDKIQFTEPPDLGSSFTGFYIGKLRQLDDIGFEFDSLRQSFNLKRDDIFYSLTLTDGVQSSVIRPENNILVSVNGVLQEPGVGFEIVGSRIIFSEIPRFGSTFVAFSYVGSEADVDADVVVPPVEAGDFIDIEGEVSDREVAVIESSNSLITFDYLGSVFGQDADATAVLTNGYIERVSVTSGGSGYTSRPVVRLDSISGFDGNVKALIGVAGVTVTAGGSGYSNPTIDVATEVPDDWNPPDLSLYGEEVIDPEVNP